MKKTKPHQETNPPLKPKSDPQPARMDSPSSYFSPSTPPKYDKQTHFAESDRTLRPPNCTEKKEGKKRPEN
jgi:hypothetical protein